MALPSSDLGTTSHRPLRKIHFVSAVPTKNSVLIEPVEFERRQLYLADAMFTIIFSLFYSIRQGLRNRAVLHAEILALRHRLLVLQRSNGSHRPRLELC